MTGKCINRLKFTLLELLIVITIISFLAAILLPALQAVKAKSYAIQCSSNMRQICLGLQAYTTDNNSFFPLYSYRMYNDLLGGDYPIETEWSWGYALYIGDYASNKIFLCPSAAKIYTFGSASTGPNGVINRPDSIRFYYIGYGYSNYYVGSRWSMLTSSSPTSERVVPPKITEMTKPSQCLTNAENKVNGTPVNPRGSYKLDDGSGIYNFHSGGCNLVFADGHVSFLKNASFILNLSDNRTEAEKYYKWK